MASSWHPESSTSQKTQYRKKPSRAAEASLRYRRHAWTTSRRFSEICRGKSCCSGCHRQRGLKLRRCRLTLSRLNRIIPIRRESHQNQSSRKHLRAGNPSSARPPPRGAPGRRVGAAERARAARLALCAQAGPLWRSRRRREWMRAIRARFSAGVNLIESNRICPIRRFSRAKARVLEWKGVELSSLPLQG